MTTNVPFSLLSGPAPKLLPGVSFHAFLLHVPTEGCVGAPLCRTRHTVTVRNRYPDNCRTDRGGLQQETPASALRMAAENREKKNPLYNRYNSPMQATLQPALGVDNTFVVVSNCRKRPTRSASEMCSRLQITPSVNRALPLAETRFRGEKKENPNRHGGALSNTRPTCTARFVDRNRLKTPHGTQKYDTTTVL